MNSQNFGDLKHVEHLPTVDLSDEEAGAIAGGYGAVLLLILADASEKTKMSGKIRGTLLL
ncbi:MAG: hypothetical protein WBA43_15545 [Elainellaceae cyanobacterium]